MVSSLDWLCDHDIIDFSKVQIRMAVISRFELELE